MSNPSDKYRLFISYAPNRLQIATRVGCLGRHLVEEVAARRKKQKSAQSRSALFLRAFSKADAGAAAVLVDELDARFKKHSFNDC